MKYANNLSTDSLIFKFKLYIIYRHAATKEKPHDDEDVDHKANSR